MRRLPLLLVVLLSGSSWAAKPVKAKFVCKKILKDQSAWELGNDDGYKVEGLRIECTLSTRDKRAEGALAVIHTAWSMDGVQKPGRDRSGEPNSEDGFEWYFVLDKGTDWDTCATSLTIPVTLTDVVKNQVIFKQELKIRQDCAPVPVAPPVGSGGPVPDGAKWDDGAQDKIPQDARATAQSFIDAVVDSDPPSLSAMGSKGVKVGKKTLKGDALYDPTSLGIKPLLECEGSECKWGPWVTVPKSATEFWIYSRSDSGYGKFSCAVFTKSGSEWRWSAVRSYDTGEP